MGGSYARPRNASTKRAYASPQVVAEKKEFDATEADIAKLRAFLAGGGEGGTGNDMPLLGRLRATHDAAIPFVQINGASAVAAATGSIGAVEVRHVSAHIKVEPTPRRFEPPAQEVGRPLRLGGRPPEVAAPLESPWPPSQDHGAAVWAAAPLQDRHDFGDLHVPPPPAPPLPPGSPLSRATSISSSASPAVADCSMSRDEFGRQVEALDAHHEFSHDAIAQLHDLISRTRPNKPQNQVVALVFANTRGGSCFLDADKGVGLIVGLPAHLAPLVVHSPSLGRFVIGMARFQAAHTHNFCYCVNVKDARARAYSSLVAARATTRESTAFSKKPVKSFLTFALECGCRPIDIMRTCPFAPLVAARDKKVRKRRRDNAGPSAISDLLERPVAVRAAQPPSMTDDLLAARDTALAARASALAE